MKSFYGDNSQTQIRSAFYTAPHAHGPRSSQVRFLRGKYCYITYFRHTLSHLVTHHMTSYFVYYFVQVLFRGLPSFRTMSLFIFVYLSSHSVPPHCCLPWPHLSFYVRSVLGYISNVTLATDLPHSSVIVYKGHLVLLCSLVCNLVL